MNNEKTGNMSSFHCIVFINPLKRKPNKHCLLPTSPQENQLLIVSMFVKGERNNSKVILHVLSKVLTKN